MITTAMLIFVLISVICGRLVFFNPEFVTRKKSGFVHNTPVSIIIPAKNEARNLPYLISSIIKQTAQSEIIVVNDGSNDNTSEVLKIMMYSKLNWKKIHGTEKVMSVTRGRNMQRMI